MKNRATKTFTFSYTIQRSLVTSLLLSLLRFYHHCNRYLFEALAMPGEEKDLICETNAIYQRLKKELNAKEYNVEYIFLMRNYSLWKASLRIGLGGQAPESYPLIRACMESAIYCRFMFKSDDRKLFKIWIDRKDPTTGKVTKEFRNNFGWGTMLKSVHSDDLRNAADMLYETSIEYGAHPNVAGILVGSREIDGERPRLRYLGSDDVTRRLCGLNLILVGLTSLGIFLEHMPEEFDRLGLHTELISLYERAITYAKKTIDCFNADNAGGSDEETKDLYKNLEDALFRRKRSV